MSHAVSADGTQVAFEQTGHGPAIVLIHGGFVDRRASVPVATELARQFTVVLVDRRGHGESGPYRDDHAIEREFEDVAAVVAALPRPVTLVGHSYGAWCALHGALLSVRSGVPVERLVLYEPPPLWDVRDPVIDRIRSALAAGATDEAVATLLQDVTAIPGPTVERLRGSPFWQLVSANARGFVPELEAGRRFALDAQAVRTLTTPTLLLAGTESPPFLRPVTDRLASILPDARVREIEGQGHGAMSSVPAQFAALVADFARS